MRLPLLKNQTHLAKTRAPHNVWKGSERADIGKHFFDRTTKAEMMQRYLAAKAWNRHRIKGRNGGLVGSSAMRVLEALTFDFYNFKTGRCDPSYDGIASRTGLSRRAVASALARLADLGILSWQRRCVQAINRAGQWCLRQVTNAYTVRPMRFWKGYTGQPEPAVDPETWGAVPPLPQPLEQAKADLKRGSSQRAAWEGLGASAEVGSLGAEIYSLFATVRRAQGA